MTPPDVPRLCAGVPGVGGRARVEPDDFRVEEVPLYPACGAGEHLYLTIEKRGLTTIDMVERVARALRVRPSAVGYAGLKDARAVTVQRISIAGVAEDAAARVDLPGIRVVEVTRHRNKIKKGHLRGNRFVLRLRGTVPDAVERARRILSDLGARGVPNAFGPQRFGNRGDTHALGFALVRGEGEAFCRALLSDPAAGEARAAAVRGDLDGAIAALPDRLRVERKVLTALARGRGVAPGFSRDLPRVYRELYLSAMQAALFNAVLARRFETFDRLLPGDLAWLHRNGAVFAVTDPEGEQPRAAAFEISPSGPLFGARCPLATGAPGDAERGALAAAGLAEDDFQRRDLRGGRRPLRVPVTDPEVETDGGDLIVAFQLPPGAYATVVLRELQGEETAAGVDPVSGVGLAGAGGDADPAGEAVEGPEET